MNQSITPKLSAIGLAISTLALAGCHRPASQEGPTPQSIAPRVLEGKIFFPENSQQLSSLATAPVSTCRDCGFYLSGRVEWDEEVTVRVFSPFAGRVQDIKVNSGMHVERDVPLASVASADYGQLQADVRKAATDLTLAEQTARRLRALADRGAVAVKDLATAEAELARARSEAQRTSTRLGLYGGSRDAAENHFALRAPLAGTVVERNVSPGQEVRPDQMLAGVERLAAPLFVITDPTRLWLMLDLTETDASRVTIGQRLRIQASTHPAQKFEARLDYIGDSLDPITRTVRCRATVDNTTRLLKAGQLVSVEVEIPANSLTLDVPAIAVFLKGDRHYVFSAVGGGAFARREVQVGGVHHGRLQVIDGLKAGDEVVTDGVMLLEQIWESAPSGPANAAQESPASPTSTI